MVRAELDGPPIEEISEIGHRSETTGKGHLCGHDGHMTNLMALAKGLGREPPVKGRALLMFRPAEENCAGATAVLADPKFAEIKPDIVFSLHNFPGLSFGPAAVRTGAANCASRGIACAPTSTSQQRRSFSLLKHLPIARRRALPYFSSRS